MSNPLSNANDLRFAGEEADSIRDQPAFLVRDEKGKPHVVAAKDLNGRTPLLELFTETRGAGMRGNVKVQLIVDGKPYTKEIPHLDDADSVFLTQAAVDKFVLPYYMRFRSAGQVGAMENKLFNVQDVLAAFHIPGSILFGFPPKIGVISLNRNTGDCECTLIPGDDDGAASTDNPSSVGIAPSVSNPPNAKKQSTKSGRKNAAAKSKAPAKKPRKR